jgi:hypothetical protein
VRIVHGMKLLVPLVRVLFLVSCGTGTRRAWTDYVVLELMLSLSMTGKNPLDT